jgi:hypothetical protein
MSEHGKISRHRMLTLGEIVDREDGHDENEKAESDQRDGHWRAPWPDRSLPTDRATLVPTNRRHNGRQQRQPHYGCPMWRLQNEMGVSE